MCLTHPTLTRQEVWTTFRRTHAVRMRERSHCLVLLLDGKTGADSAPWLSRDAETSQRGGHAGRRQRTRPPAYAPERHPHERIWQGRRRGVTHKHGLATLSEASQAPRDCFSSLTGRTTQGQQLCGLKTPESLLALL